MNLHEAFRGERSLQESRVLPDELFATPAPERFSFAGSTATGAASAGAALAAGPSAKPRSRPEGLAPGTILDKYRLEALLGVGAFGMVYRATHLLLRRPVALKLLRPEVLARRPGLHLALLDEARLAARINHPNVVRILDVTRHAELSYLVMEYIAGPTLLRALRTRGVLSAPEVLRIAREVASGLRAGLQQGLVHRDVKPANILLSKEGSAHLVDFGLALAIGREEERQAPAGTRGYMAPEVVAGGQGDWSSDLYSLGVTLAECLGASPPFAPGGPLSEAKGMQHLLEAALQPESGRRPRSYDEFLALVDAVEARI